MFLNVWSSPMPKPLSAFLITDIRHPPPPLVISFLHLVCKSGKNCRVFEQFHFEVHVRSEIFAWSQLDSPPEFVMETVDNVHLTYYLYYLHTFFLVGQFLTPLIIYTCKFYQNYQMMRCRLLFLSNFWPDVVVAREFAHNF